MNEFNEAMRSNPLESSDNTIDETAIISPLAKIGKGNIIEAYTLIESGVVIGDNNYIGPHCIIGFKPESREFFAKHSGKVQIGNNNRFYKQVTIDGATDTITIIADNCEFLKNSHVGHDAFIWDQVSLRCNAVIGGFCEIHKGVIVGLNASVHQRVEVPKNISIGMNSCVTKKVNLQENSIYGGVPIRWLKKRL